MAKFNLLNNLFDHAYVVIFTSSLIVVVMAVAFFWPGFQELKLLQQSIEEKKAELERKEDYILKLHQAEMQLQEHQEEFSKIKSALPEDPSLPSLFNYLQKIASESGLILYKVDPFTVSFSKEIDDLRETVFSIELSGSYSSLKYFLSSLEKSARLIEVENISFSFPKEEEESYVFNLKIRTHSL